jgi:hypothetical protein
MANNKQKQIADESILTGLEAFHQLQLAMSDPVQERYEVARPDTWPKDR